ncbi:ribosomal RNA-processing protein 7 homolog A [Neodiprion pinetum]|uniref:ribosomal RNA-processing protein 7 homolog A n=1 Tax=Neodiprion pinetum TaxID=441929 RepID=UPI001EE04632|nr:ribosomal RNA-processing protein 7 homolog A [Neodiprion pinetum]
MTVNKQMTNGYKVLWIRYGEPNSERHQIFIKEHSLRKQEPQYPKGRTLFVLNISPYISADSITNAFAERCGPVKSVTFAPRHEESQNGFKVCYIVFEKESGLDKALLLPENYVLLLKSTEDSTTGIIKWCKQYNNSVCDEEKTQKEIEEYMHGYDQRVANRLMEASAKAENRGNPDGWTVVTGTKKRGQRALLRKESAIGKVRQKQAKSNEKKQLLNFYTFQIRDSKKQNLAELRKKFEQDKEKLQQLKIKRTFKPF